MRLSISLIFFLFLSTQVFATTYYVRPDGGRCQNITSSGYDSPGDTVFAKQCDGLTDHALAGATGTNCACNHPGWVIGQTGGVAALWSAGDTLIIKNNADGSQASYEVGCVSTAPNGNCMDYRVGINNSGTCFTSYPYGCTLRNIPAGIDASHPTRILGEGYAYCPTTTVKPSIWGTQRLPYNFQTTNGNIEFQCLDITDHSACIYAGPVSTDVDGFPTKCVRTVAPDSGPWSHDGIQMSGVPDNILARNIDVHGMGRYGIIVGLDNVTSTYGNLTFDNVRAIANGWGGIQTNNNMTSTTSYTATFKNGTTVDYNGCGEHYPLVGALDSLSNIHNCSSQSQIASAADGIAFGNAGAGLSSNWVLDRVKVRWNTQDGFDILHGVVSANSVKITRSVFEGNAGNAIKTVGKYNYIEHNKIIANCGFFHGQTFTSTKDNAGNSVGFDNCRAGGSPLVFDYGAGFNNLFKNNTIFSNGRFVLEGAHGSDCDSNTLTQSRNNLIYGGYSWEDDTTWNGAGANALTTMYWPGDLSGTCTSSYVALDQDYDNVYGTSGNDSSCAGSHSKCHLDPAPTGTIKIGNHSDANYYQGVDYADQWPLSVSSNSKGFGVSGLTYQNGSSDYNNYPQNSPADIGALQYGTTATCWADGNTCVLNSDCCNSNCNNNVCGAGATTITGSYAYNIKLQGSLKFQ